MATTKKESATGESKFTKDTLIKAVKYSDRRDLIEALLDEGKSYTLSEVDDLISKFYKKEV